MRSRLFLALWIALTLVAGMTLVAAERLDMGGAGGDQVVQTPTDTERAGDEGGTAREPTIVPGPGQVRISGTVTALHIEGAVLDPREVPVPLTIVAERGFGNGGELTGVVVSGDPSSIVWDGGRSFVLSSGRGLRLDPVTVDLAPEGLRLALAGVHVVLPGTYRLDTPVAVGSSGMATARDGVTFEAGADARFEAHGNAALLLEGPGPHRFLGPGDLVLEGSLEVTDAEGTRAAPTFAADEAAFDLTLTLGSGGWAVQGVIDTAGA